MDTILIHLLASKLDWKTRREWEEEIGDNFVTKSQGCRISQAFYQIAVKYWK